VRVGSGDPRPHLDLLDEMAKRAGLVERALPAPDHQGERQQRPRPDDFWQLSS
jgi:hypothetical protein